MKSLIFCVAVCFIIADANAQNDSAFIRKVKFGIAAVVNFTKSPALSYENITPNYYVYKKSKYAPGFAARFFMEYNSSSKLSIQPEVGFVYYHQRQVYSASPDNKDDRDRHSDDLYVSAFTVSTLFKYATKYITITTGPQVDFPISARINNFSLAIGSNGPVEREYKVDLKDEKKIISAVFNWNFGLERVVSKNFRLQANYQLGLTEYTKTHILRKISRTSGFYLGGALMF